VEIAVQYVLEETESDADVASTGSNQAVVQYLFAGLASLAGKKPR
jgi:hypothetical protein